jgi:peptide/nickel transport system permease protein
MVTFLARRLAGLVLTLLVSSFVVFAAVYLAPGSPIGFLTGGRSLSPETIASIKAQYHLDDPCTATSASRSSSARTSGR